MNCPHCLESEVIFPMQVVSASSGMLGPELFKDGRGVSHLHDPNVTVTVYRCPMDHEWSTVQGASCMCGWSALDEHRRAALRSGADRHRLFSGREHQGKQAATEHDLSNLRHLDVRGQEPQQETGDGDD